MEAIDVYKEEVLKLKEHEEECRKLGKEVTNFTNLILNFLSKKLMCTF